jgi:hypothetical protein
MNAKKIIGLALWLVALLIPFQYSFLETTETGNVTGLTSFVAVLALLFVGYALVDSASAKAEGQHGH